MLWRAAILLFDDVPSISITTQPHIFYFSYHSGLFSCRAYLSICPVVMRWIRTLITTPPSPWIVVFISLMWFLSMLYLPNPLMVLHILTFILVAQWAKRPSITTRIHLPTSPASFAPSRFSPSKFLISRFIHAGIWFLPTRPRACVSFLWGAFLLCYLHKLEFSFYKVKSGIKVPSDEVSSYEHRSSVLVSSLSFHLLSNVYVSAESLHAHLFADKMTRFIILPPLLTVI